MPNITGPGTYDKDTAGFRFLGAATGKRCFLFAGSSTGTSTTMQYTDDTGSDQTFANGTISTLPASVIVEANCDIKIVCTGSPNFNLTMFPE